MFNQAPNINWISAGLVVFAISFGTSIVGTSNALSHASSVANTAAVGASATSTYTISGVVWNDLSGNGTKDGPETGIVGDAILLKDSNTGALIKTSVSTLGGGYKITNVSAGTYRVSHAVPLGYERTTDNSFVFTLSANRTANFGIKKTIVASTTDTTKPPIFLTPPTNDAASSTQVAVGGNCSAQKVAEIFGSKGSSVLIDCNLTLKSTDVIKKTVVFAGAEASNLTLDCKGGRIVVEQRGVALQVRSKKITDTQYSRPENILIKNCIIGGEVIVSGMVTGPSPFSLGHTQRAQDAAPRHITLDNVTIDANGAVAALKFLPGVTYSSLINSELVGETEFTAIYFSPESAYNTIAHNRISVDTGGQQCLSIFCFGEDREVLSLDGSANNLILSNGFTHIRHGGIFLYRNCGEDGMVRHQTPSGNKIINNHFYYGHDYASDVDQPAIWLGSRNGDRDYCDLDKAYPFGSGKDDRDFAQNNVVMQNQIRLLSTQQAIRTGGSSNTPNYFFGNVTVDDWIARKAGCYVENGYPAPFLLDGQSVTRFTDRVTGAVICTGKQMSCSDGDLTSKNISCPAQ